jgi:hypothetical protein
MDYRRLDSLDFAGRLGDTLSRGVESESRRSHDDANAGICFGARPVGYYTAVRFKTSLAVASAHCVRRAGCPFCVLQLRFGKAIQVNSCGVKKNWFTFYGTIAARKIKSEASMSCWVPNLGHFCQTRTRRCVVT